MQFENLAAQYEKEINELRASNQEQSQDLHCMIQTVNEVKEQNSVKRIKQVPKPIKKVIVAPVKTKETVKEVPKIAPPKSRSKP